jgi:hypothetical protein
MSFGVAFAVIGLACSFFVIDTTRLAQAEAHGAETGQLESTLELDDMDTESVDSSSSSPSEFALARSPRARALALLHAFFDVGDVVMLLVCVCVCVYVCMCVV